MDLTTIALSDLVAPFISELRDGSIEIYNEFSLQHELGIFLRTRYPESRVRFERNVGALFNSTTFVKREIDIVASCRATGALQLALVLKFPRNGQHPEQMFSFCKDISFAEELRLAGFARTGFIVFAEDDLFWRGPAEGIYSFFRSSRPLTGTITKPTGKKDQSVSIRGTYGIKWQDAMPGLRFAIVEPSLTVRHL